MQAVSGQTPELETAVPSTPPLAVAPAEPAVLTMAPPPESAAAENELRRENAALRARVAALENALLESNDQVRTLEAKLEAVLTVPQPEDTKKPRVYRVREGDTLYTIAQRPEIYNDARLWRRILEANRQVLADPAKLQPGQQLIIPR